MHQKVNRRLLCSACILTATCSCSCSHLSTILGNKFDHGAEAIVPVLFNLIPNCAKVMAMSGVSAIRIIIRVGFGREEEVEL